MQSSDPYALDSSKVIDPPKTLSGTLRHLGPGFLLSASIVGSGELVATTQLGAQAGFVAMWVILVSCLVKVAVQLEFGKRAIMTGETTFASFNSLPGPKIGRANWTIWTWLLLMVFKFLQVGGIVGLVAVLLNMAIPSVGILIWLCLLVIVIAAIVASGRYRLLELLSVTMIGLFTLFTFVSLIALQFTPEAFSLGDVLSGLTFQFPAGEAMLLVVIGAFGITGVGGDEIMAYNYWLIEKGYAANTGKNDGSEAWRQRARGWIKVMYIDAIVAMLVYTIVTVAFFLLGAALLHGVSADISKDGGLFLRNSLTFTPRHLAHGPRRSSTLAPSSYSSPPPSQPWARGRGSSAMLSVRLACSISRILPSESAASVLYPSLSPSSGPACSYSRRNQSSWC